MNELPPNVREVILKLEQGLRELYGDRYRGLLLYGSYARGSAWEGSDVDLLLLLEGPVNVGKEIFATNDIASILSLESGLLLAVMPTDVEAYRCGSTIFLRSIQKDAIRVAA